MVVGDIEDEHDDDESPMIVPDGDGMFLADARADLDDVVGRDRHRPFAAARRARTSTPSADWSSACSAAIPVRGELITAPGGFEFEILDADPRRIKRLRIRQQDERTPARAAPQAATGRGPSGRRGGCNRGGTGDRRFDRSGGRPFCRGMERIAGPIIRLRGWRRLALAARRRRRCRRSRSRRSTSFRCFWLTIPVFVWLIDGAVRGERRGAGRTFLAAAARRLVLRLRLFRRRAVVDRRRLPGRRRPVRLADAPRRRRPARRARAVLGAWAPALARAVLERRMAAHPRLRGSDGGGRMAPRPYPHRVPVERLRLRADADAGDDAVGGAGRPLGADARRLRHLRRTGRPRPGAARRRRAAAGSSPAFAAALLAAHVGYGAFRLADAGEPVAGPAIRIVQPALEQSEKWQAENEDEIVRRYLTLSQAASPDRPGLDGVALLIWPESAFPFLLTDRPEVLTAIGDAPAGGDDADHRRGSRRRAGRRRCRSSTASYVIDDQGTITAAYDKVHLVPFGEYLPFRTLFDLLGIRQLVAMPEGFSAGASRAHPDGPRRRALRAADLLRDHLPRRRRRHPVLVRAGCSTSPMTPGSATRQGRISIFYKARVA